MFVGHLDIEATSKGPANLPDIVAVPAARDVDSLLERADLPTELTHLRERLIAQFSPAIPEHIVDEEIDRALGSLGTVRLHHFVPILVERQVRQRLKRAVATSRNEPPAQASERRAG